MPFSTAEATGCSAASSWVLEWCSPDAASRGVRPRAARGNFGLMSRHPGVEVSQRNSSSQGGRSPGRLSRSMTGAARWLGAMVAAANDLGMDLKSCSTFGIRSPVCTSGATTPWISPPRSPPPSPPKPTPTVEQVFVAKKLPENRCEWDSKLGRSVIPRFWFHDGYRPCDPHLHVEFTAA